MLEPFIMRMHCDGDIAQHGLRPRSRDDDKFTAAFDRIFDVPEMTLRLDLLNLQIRNSSFERRVPIDQPLILVDEAFPIKVHKRLKHRANHLFVRVATLSHGEALARPVAGGAEPLELADDDAAGFRLPFPDSLDEGLAAHGAARL